MIQDPKTDEASALAALVEKWRAKANSQPGRPFYAILECADELASALASSPPASPLLAVIAEEFERAERESRDTADRIRSRHERNLLGDESHLLAHYEMLTEHYGSRARAVRSVASPPASAPPCSRCRALQSAHVTTLAQEQKRQADARLIAAAPKLLVALKQVTDAFINQRDYALGNGDAEDYEAVRMAHAAIAEAEGQ